jgi:hypothetical protein
MAPPSGGLTDETLIGGVLFRRAIRAARRMSHFLFAVHVPEPVIEPVKSTVPVIFVADSIVPW